MISFPAFFDELQKIGEASSFGKQLRMGELTEREHKGTVDWLKKNPQVKPEIAFGSIARDHLKEDPKYYTHLKEMEDKYRGKVGKLEKASVYAAEQTGEGGDPTQTSGGTVRG
jgi:hypothetical protein